MSDPLIASLEDRIATSRAELRTTQDRVRSLQRRRPNAMVLTLAAAGVPLTVLFWGAFAAPVPAALPSTVRALFTVRGASGNVLMQVLEDPNGAGVLSVDDGTNHVVVLRSDGNGNGKVIVNSPTGGRIYLAFGNATNNGYVAISDISDSGRGHR